ncbi:MAG TPA: metallophosphoesterase [Phycisphaerae bacterium]|nr:metallophosphoesterase [Phycisphaerae bacterium]
MRGRLALMVLGMVLAGCVPGVPGGHVRFANVAGVYYSATPDVKVEGALVEDSAELLARAVAQLTATKGLDFVLISGDLLACADALSLDRAKAVLDELPVPYYVVLGGHDGPDPGAPGPSRGLSRSNVIWAFQGHGFDGPEGYWRREVKPGLVVVGLDTGGAGCGAGHVDARQLDWLRRTLEADRDKAVLVVAHHGLVVLHPLDEGSVWRDLLVDNRDAVREILAQHPNVLAVITGHHHFGDGRASGPTVYLASPSVSVWPLAYHLVDVSAKEVEAVWIPLDSGDLARKAQERLLGSDMYRGVFPPGEDGDTACVRLFGGGKMVVVPLPAIRP